MSAGAAPLTRVRWVCFDVGETLIDETHHWAAWADWLGHASRIIWQPKRVF